MGPIRVISGSGSPAATTLGWGCFLTSKVRTRRQPGDIGAGGLVNDTIRLAHGSWFRDRGWGNLSSGDEEGDQFQSGLRSSTIAALLASDLATLDKLTRSIRGFAEGEGSTQAVADLSDEDLELLVAVGVVVEREAFWAICVEKAAAEFYSDPRDQFTPGSFAVLEDDFTANGVLLLSDRSTHQVGPGKDGIKAIKTAIANRDSVTVSTKPAIPQSFKEAKADPNNPQHGQDYSLGATDLSRRRRLLPPRQTRNRTPLEEPPQPEPPAEE